MATRRELLRNSLIALTAAAGIVNLFLPGLAPGKASGLRHATARSADSTIVEITTELHDVYADLRLAVVADPHPSLRYRAALEDSPALAVRRLPSKADTILLEITAPDSSALRRQKFLWPSNRTLRLIALDSAAAAPPIQVARWRINPRDQEYDSSERQKRRKLLSIVGWLAFGVLLLGTLITTFWKEAARPETPQAFTAEYCLRQLIERVDGDNDKETTRIRTLLRKYLLERAELDEAFSAAGFEVARAPTGEPVYSQPMKTFWIRATGRLNKRLAPMITGLSDAQKLLLVDLGG